MRSWLVCFAMIACFAVCMLFGGTEVFAQDTASEVQFIPIVNFGNLFDTIRTALGPIVVGALGLGLAIWGARYIFSVIKSMGR